MTVMICQKKITSSCLLFLLTVSATIMPILLSSPLFGNNLSDQGAINQNSDPRAAIAPIEDGKWWNNSWQYRIGVYVNASTLARSDSLFEIWINFTDLLVNQLKVTGEQFDINSIRVIEQDNQTGTLIVHNASDTLRYPDGKYEVPCSLWDDLKYNALTNANFKVSWVLNGTTPANSIRTYCVYFDIVANGPKQDVEYWQYNRGTLTGTPIERLNNDATTTNTLYYLKSANTTAFMSGTTSNNPQWRGQLVRTWYKTDTTSTRVNRYYIDYVAWEVANRANVPGTVTNLVWSDNKLTFANWYSYTEEVRMNLTYEVFENSIFTRVIATVESLGYSGNVPIRYSGDTDYQTSSLHIDDTGDITEPTFPVTKWLCMWSGAAGHNGVLGYVLNPANSETIRLIDTGEFFEIYGEVKDLATIGDKGQFSFYVVSGPKGSVGSESKYVGDLYNDLYTPKIHTFGEAQFIAPTIVVNVTDWDNFPVTGATVFLNRSESGSQVLDTQTTNAQGVCTFHTQTNGQYNFTVNITSETSEITLQTNWTAINQLFDTHRRYIYINSSAWKINFNIKDVDGQPLPVGNTWILVNNSETGYLENVSLDLNGDGNFQWINGSVYNYTVYYHDPLYNGGIPITVYGAETQFTSHVQFTLETVNIVVPMSRVNFTVSGWVDPDLTALFGAIIEVYNSSTGSGVPNTSDMLGEMPVADVNGNAFFYWRTREAGPQENYSIYVKVGGSNSNQLNQTNGPPFSDFSKLYQNFTLTSSFNKSVVVNFDTASYEARMIRVNPSVNNHYWNTHTVIQVIYEHKAGASQSWVTAAPSWIRYTISQGGVPIVSDVAMVATSQVGRYEATLDMAALGMVAGESYTVEINAVEGGFQVPTPITYLINVLALPTTMDAQQTSFQSVWGDVNSTTVQYSTVYPNTLIYDYQVRNYTSSSFTVSIPKIENEWQLTKVEFNFSNIVAPGGYLINAYDDITKVEGIGYVTGSGNTAYQILTNESIWPDTNLDFTIVGSGTFVSCDVTARGYFTRTAVVINQTVNYLDEGSVLYLDSPGVGWKLNRLLLDVETASVIPGDLRFSLENRTAPFDIDDVHQVYTGLEYYLNPQVNYIAINFSAGSGFAFNATFSCEFERILDKNNLGDTDLGIFDFGVLGVADKTVDMTLLNKFWNITKYDLTFTGFTNTTYELVKHEDYTIQIFLDGQWNDITPLGVGTFSFAISTPQDSPTLSFQIDYPSISAFNLTISRTNIWQNVWGVEGASLSYYLFSNSSVTGTLPTVGLFDGDYFLSFDTSKALIGTQILKLSGSRTNYATATVDLTFTIDQIPTEVNGSTIFNRNRRIYKTETHVYYIEYNDTYHLQDGHSIGISGATATYFVGYYSLEDPDADTPISTDGGVLAEIQPGLYLLDYNTNIQTEGIYKFSLSFEMPNNAYEPRNPTLTVRIDLIPSQSTPYNSIIQEKTQRDNATISFLLADGRGDHQNEYYPEGLTDVAVTFTSANTFSSTYMFWKNGTGDGFFNLTVDTRSILPATYTLQVTFSRANYTTNSTGITITVNRFQPIVTPPSGVVTVTEGQEASIALSVTDSLPELGQTFEAIVISWNVEGTSLSDQITVVNAQGDYTISFPTTALSAATNYNVLVTVQVTVGGVVYTYASTLTINVRVEYEQIFGIPRPYFWIMMVAVVALVGTLVIYRYVKYARIPQFVRDIQRVRTTIRKNKSAGRESITESRGESISRALEMRYAALGMSPSEKFAPKPIEEAGKAGGERKPEEEVA